jgi:hypothetical protein
VVVDVVVLVSGVEVQSRRKKTRRRERVERAIEHDRPLRGSIVAPVEVAPVHFKSI